MQVYKEIGAQVSKQSSSAFRISFLPPPESGHSEARVLLIGAGASLVQALSETGTGPQRVQIVGVLNPTPAANGTLRQANVTVLGSLEDLEPVIAQYCVDEIRVVLPEPQITSAMPTLEATAEALGVAITFSLPTDVQTVRQEKTNGRKLVIHRAEHPSRQGVRGLVKRSVDVLVSGIALLLLAPLFCIIAIAIKLTSSGPVLFHQQRIGTGRRKFRMLKFRTMLQNAEQLRERIQEKNNARGISFKVFDDPRVTPLGGLLRRASLDELPQLINVFLGDMTLVGPRPIPVWVAEQMQGSAYLRRFSVKQGVTGLWQVEGRQQDFDFMATQDLRYVDQWSLALDLKVLLKTLPAVIRGESAY